MRVYGCVRIFWVCVYRYSLSVYWILNCLDYIKLDSIVFRSISFPCFSQFFLCILKFGHCKLHICSVWNFTSSIKENIYSILCLYALYPILKRFIFCLWVFLRVLFDALSVLLGAAWLLFLLLLHIELNSTQLKNKNWPQQLFACLICFSFHLIGQPFRHQ